MNKNRKIVLYHRRLGKITLFVSIVQGEQKVAHNFQIRYLDNRSRSRDEFKNGYSPDRGEKNGIKKIDRSKYRFLCSKIDIAIDRFFNVVLFPMICLVSMVELIS